MVILILNFLKNHHTVFHRGSTTLYSYQQCKRILVSPHPLQHLLFSSFLFGAILISTRWHFTVVLIGDTEHCFIHSLPICICSLPIVKLGYMWCLAGSVGRMYHSWSQGHDLKPHAGCGAYLKLKKGKNKIGMYVFCCCVVRLLYIMWILQRYSIYDILGLFFHSAA